MIPSLIPVHKQEEHKRNSGKIRRKIKSKIRRREKKKHRFSEASHVSVKYKSPANFARPAAKRKQSRDEGGKLNLVIRSLFYRAASICMTIEPRYVLGFLASSLTFLLCRSFSYFFIVFLSVADSLLVRFSGVSLSGSTGTSLFLLRTDK